MESSFKKDYGRVVNSDGSVELKFKSRRFGGGLAALAVPVLLLSSCATSFYPVVNTVGLGSGYNEHIGTFFGVWVAISIALFFVLYQLVCYKRSSLLIKPNEGLIFDGKQLPYKDIQRLLVKNERNSMGFDESRVIAESHGLSIPVTQFMPDARAEIVRREIQEYSGKDWNLA